MIYLVLDKRVSWKIFFLFVRCPLKASCHFYKGDNFCDFLSEGLFWTLFQRWSRGGDRCVCGGGGCCLSESVFLRLKKSMVHVLWIICYRYQKLCPLSSDSIFTSLRKLSYLKIVFSLKIPQLHVSTFYVSYKMIGLNVACWAKFQQTTIWNIFFFLFIPGNRLWHFIQIEFAWTVKAYLLGKTQKERNHQFIVCWNFCPKSAKA